MDQEAVEVTPTGFKIGGEVHPILSGEVHSWRLDPARWGAILDLVANTGFNTVSTYVPWSVHETGPTAYDFSGARDVARFLEMAAERGLWAIVRTGPDAASEIPDSGWPRRVLQDSRIWALRSNGLPYILPTATSHVFPPSYMSQLFLDEVAHWYDAVFEVLAPLQYPDGPIIASQVDNEIGYHFQPHTFAMDYHPDSISGYREFHGGRTDTNGIGWVAWREEYLRRALDTLASMQRERGMDRVPLIHNDYPRMATPLDPTALEESGIVDVAAGDIYTGKEGGYWMKEFVRYVAGTSRHPFLLELGAGWLTLPWIFPVRVSPIDQEHITLRAFLGGIRSANVYMLVERDRWYASPIAADGTPRPERLDLYRRLKDMLSGTGLHEMHRWAPVLLLENRSESRRVAAREILGDYAPALPHLFPVDRRLLETPHPNTDLLRTWEAGLTRALNKSGVDFDRAVSSSSPISANTRWLSCHAWTRAISRSGATA